MSVLHSLYYVVLASQILIMAYKINVKEFRRRNQNGQSRKAENVWYTRRGQNKQQQITVCVGHHYTQTNTLT